ncbi:MAG: hypothetical protein IJW79_05795 [Clostridia bacterium]|jgi:hypothetical protein|nr:hypothetical protein [Clostridia bacterium]
MKKSKSQAVVTVVLLVMTVILFCFIGFKIYEQNFKTNNTTEPIVSTSITDNTTASQATVDIPEIPERPNIGSSAVSEKADIEFDIGSVENNPGPEFIEAEVEYGTKEVK